VAPKFYCPILKFLTGDNIFISYSRHDGDAYATQLANKLVDLKFSVYFDQWNHASWIELARISLAKAEAEFSTDCGRHKACG
jgi:hypothetical protein